MLWPAVPCLQREAAMRNDAKHTFALRALIFPIQVIGRARDRRTFIQRKDAFKRLLGSTLVCAIFHW